MSEQKWFEKAHCDWIDSLSHRRVLDTEQTAFLAGFKARADLAAERERALGEAREVIARLLMWEPKSTEAACEQDYDAARALLATHEHNEGEL